MYNPVTRPQWLYLHLRARTRSKWISQTLSVYKSIWSICQHGILDNNNKVVLHLQPANHHAPSIKAGRLLRRLFVARSISSINSSHKEPLAIAVPSGNDTTGLFQTYPWKSSQGWTMGGWQEALSRLGQKPQSADISARVLEGEGFEREISFLIKSQVASSCPILLFLFIFVVPSDPVILSSASHQDAS